MSQLMKDMTGFGFTQIMLIMIIIFPVIWVLMAGHFPRLGLIDAIESMFEYFQEEKRKQNEDENYKPWWKRIKW